jgi:hypothetical protein
MAFVCHFILSLTLSYFSNINPSTMKTLLLASAFGLMLTACGSSKEEQLIADYEQTVGSTKLDLKLNVEKLEPLGDVKASDSIAYYTGLVNGAVIDEEAYTKVQEFIELYENEWAESTQKVMRPQYEIALIFQMAKKGLIKYEGNPEQVLAKKYKATYSIENPILNNVKQTISKVYYFAPDISAILASE